MPSTIDMPNQPVLPSNNPAAPNQFEQPYNPNINYNRQPVQQSQPVVNDTKPEIEIGGFHFTTKKDDDSSDPMTITTEPTEEEPKKKRSYKKKEVATVNTNDIVKADGEVVDTPTINTYFETASMLKTAMMQIDSVSNEIKIELDNVKNSRTMKSKYNVMVGLAGNLSDLMEAKISAIKELNNCISKSNDMDYKREKDRKEASAGVADDKTIMDLYTAFVQNPGNVASNGYMTPIGPTNLAASVAGSDIVRAPADQNESAKQIDAGYMNYLANMTPEMNHMLYEQNPDIKQCVVFDAATGNKWFQVMNVKTGQIIPNADVHDQMFMEDTVLDLRNKIAKNNNLHETYPLVILNEQNANNY